MSVSRRAVLAGAAGAALLGAGRARAAPPLTLRRGINLWPWFSLTREFPAPRTDYDWPPFQLDRQIPMSRDLAQLRRAGFDFVRIPVDPGPIVAAAPRERALLLDQVMAAVALALGQDLAVVLNLHGNAATHHWNPAYLFGSEAAPGFPAYLAVIAELARRLGRLVPGRVALEPVNEPFQACGDAEWERVQKRMLAAARSAAPDLTLVATGACGSMIAGLGPLKAKALAAFEPLLFTFHFYEPYLFSHQGAKWMSEPFYPALNGVPWPASHGSLEATLAAVRARMAVLGQPASGRGAATYRETERVLREYFDARPDRPFIEGYLGQVGAWAQREGVAPGRILMGEFGAVRTGAGIAAAAPADRARYVRDVRLSAEAMGFPWAFWNLFDVLGLLVDDVSRRLDPAMIEALGLRMPA
ncbi:cellulase family glycosylhydrolase [Bosea sp. ANAM02]|uniref:glycoside hydrolase family 5 protein n=1 Tax=Bosea sp. ANAM02 TaxID=2020412 RepID=UPI00140ED278|nr:cellulase family glycosylhydrolase [Bosea sp. ANAM02]BCB18978.1 glycosyl hydrolase family 5 [Bosea sp. ANAM02]